MVIGNQSLMSTKRILKKELEIGEIRLQKVKSV